MKHFIAVGKQKSVTFDPQEHYPESTTEDLREACGLVFPWALEALIGNMPFREHLDMSYPFGLFEMTGSTLTSDDRLCYPEDDDLYPLVKVKSESETLYQYHSGIVAIKQHSDDSLFVTRMD